MRVLVRGYPKSSSSHQSLCVIDQTMIDTVGEFNEIKALLFYFFVCVSIELLFQIEME